MDAEKLVVVTDVETILETFKTRVVAHIEPSSVTWGLIYALKGFGSNKIWENGYDILKKKYNWKTITEKNFEVYEKHDPIMKSDIRNIQMWRLMGEISSEVKLKN